MMDPQGNPVLIDFGNCRKFSLNGDHVSETDQLESFRGDVIFGSPHTLKFGKPSRRDDLYSLAYFVIYKLNDDKLPLDFDKLMNRSCNRNEQISNSLDFKSKYSLSEIASAGAEAPDNFKEFCQII
jgi:serine/threonine protein kinase